MNTGAKVALIDALSATNTARIQQYVICPGAARLFWLPGYGGLEKRHGCAGWALAALGGVIAQGILGGATVLTYQLLAVSAAHATLAQLFFSTVVAIAVFTSSWWAEASIEVEDKGSPRVRSLVIWTVVAVFLQLILGVAFRHKGFGIIPHLIGAVVVTILIFMTAGALKRRYSNQLPLRNCARMLHILIGVQLLLGGGAYWSRLYAAGFPQPIPVMVALTSCTR